MKTKKIISFLILMLTVGGLLAACGGEETSTNEGNSGEDSGGNEEELVFNMGHTVSVNNQQHAAGVRMGELLEEKTNGNITVEVYEQSQLGGEVQALQALQEGSQELTTVAHASVTNFIPDWSVLDLPYLFDSTEQANAVLAGEVGDQLFDMLPEHGLKGLAWIGTTERNVFGTSPIESGDDLQGLSIRVIEAPGFIDAYSAVGAHPTTMSGSEVYTALQQGVVDASDNSAELFINLGHHEVANYFNMTRMHMMPTPIIMSLEVWENLSSEQQDMVMEAAEEAADYSREFYYESIDEAFEEMDELGIEVIETDISELRETTQGLYDELISDVPNGQELLETIENAKEETN